MHRALGLGLGLAESALVVLGPCQAMEQRRARDIGERGRGIEWRQRLALNVVVPALHEVGRHVDRGLRVDHHLDVVPRHTRHERAVDAVAVRIVDAEEGRRRPNVGVVVVDTEPLAALGVDQQMLVVVVPAPRHVEAADERNGAIDDHGLLVVRVVHGRKVRMAYDANVVVQRLQIDLRVGAKVVDQNARLGPENNANLS